MNVLRILLAIVLAAAPLAGCLSGSEPATTASTKDAEATAPPANMTSMAGMANMSNMTMDAMLPVAYAGTTATGTCTYGIPLNQCEFSDPGKESYHVVPYAGKAKHLRVTITYGTPQPGFALYATVCTGKVGTNPNNAACSNYATAPSPMKLDVDRSSLQAGAPVALSIGDVSNVPAPAGAIVLAPLDFKVDGHMMTESI